jgi:methionyl-tRNA formyltransferase
MKVLILTTRTGHHLYYLHKLLLNKKLDIFSIFEKRKIKFTFKTNHDLDYTRDRYENFINKKNGYKYSSLKKKEIDDINSQSCINLVKKINPKIIIAYGVGKIRTIFLKNFKNKIFNLHASNPESYRGLDSFLWAIYHKDFKNFYITLHKVNKNLDTGDIIYKKKIILNKNVNIYNLRILSSETCLLLSRKIINKFLFFKKFKSEPQNIRKGRYYSAMPSALKSICVKNFNTYINKKYGK